MSIEPLTYRRVGVRPVLVPMSPHQSRYRHRLVALAMAASVATFAGASAASQFPAAREDVSIAVTAGLERGASVAGRLDVPPSANERLPAVVIVNSSPGFDGRGAFYAEAIHKAGMATLELDMFHGRGLPASPRHNMPHVYAALRHLVTHPRIDASRVAVMGFSWGAKVALLSSSADMASENAGPGDRFAAHVALYPVCWSEARVLDGQDKHLQASAYLQFTGAPVLIFKGSKDDYDGPAGCSGFLDKLPARAKPEFTYVVFPGATFAWDSRFSSATYEAGGQQGKGGIVNVVADPKRAQQSREAAVAFFRKTIGTE